MAKESGGEDATGYCTMYTYITLWCSIMFFLCLSRTMLFQILHILVFRTAPEAVRVLPSHMREQSY
jgi:hypothetical protein